MSVTGLVGPTISIGRERALAIGDVSAGLAGFFSAAAWARDVDFLKGVNMSFRYSTSDHGPSGPIALTVNHNQTYVLLKHLALVRKLAFVAYASLLGDQNTIGFLKVPLLFVCDRWSPAAIAAHFSGKLPGLRTYVRSLRVASERSRT